MKTSKKKRLVLTLLCYAAALVLWFGAAAVRLAVDGARLPEARSLEPQDFTALSGIWVSPQWEEGDRRIVTLDADPQMILEFGEEGLPLARVELRAKWVATPPGGVHLYYTTAPGQPFSESRKLWADAGPDGGWVFDLDGRRVAAIRLDPGSAGAVTWNYDAVVLNAEKPVWAYFAPDGRGVFLLLFAPLLAAAGLWEASALVSPWFARRRLEREWAKRAEP